MRLIRSGLVRKLAVTALILTCCAKTTKPLTPGPQAPIALPNVVAACERLISCQESQGVSDVATDMTIGQCLWGAVSDYGNAPQLIDDGRSRATLNCIAEAPNCDGVVSCLFGSSLKRRCPPPVNGRDQCEFLSPGTTCVTISADTHACALDTCSTATPSCFGNTLLDCNFGFLTPTDCTSEDATCNSTGDNGQPGCVGNGPACATTQAHCDSNTRVTCVGGHESRQACDGGPIPEICSDGDCTLPRTLDCDPSTTPDSCDGTSIVYCDGHYQRFDCRSIGYQRCAPWSPGVICE